MPTAYTMPMAYATPPVLVSSPTEETLLRAHIRDLDAKVADLSEQLRRCLDVCYMLGSRNLRMRDALRTTQELAAGPEPINTITRLARITEVARTILDERDDQALANDVLDFVQAYLRATEAEHVEESVE